MPHSLAICCQNALSDMREDEGMVGVIARGKSEEAVLAWVVAKPIARGLLSSHYIIIIASVELMYYCRTY